jgi:uncharacterized protein YgfB (UPF0149 family)
MYYQDGERKVFMVVGSPLRSRGYKELTLDERDLRHLYTEMTPQELHQYVGGLLCGFQSDAARSV